MVASVSLCGQVLIKDKISLQDFFQPQRTTAKISKWETTWKIKSKIIVKKK